MSGKLCIYHTGVGDNSMFILDGNNQDEMRQVSLPEGWRAELENGRMIASSPDFGMKWNIEECLHSEGGEPVLIGSGGEVVSLKYTMESFAKEIGNSLKAFLPMEMQGLDVDIRRVSKTNRSNVHSLVLHDRKAAYPVAEPTIYLEDFYTDYRNGLGMEKILEDIASAEVQMHSTPDMEFRMMAEEAIKNAFNWDYMKERVVISAVGADLNREMLQDIPHRMIGDIAGVYRVFVGEVDYRSGYIMVTNKMLESWGVTRDQLDQAALANSMSVQPARITDLRDMLKEISVLPVPEEPEVGSAGKMYVLTNRQKTNGASVLFYPDVQEMMEAVFPEGCYILPSSLHELMLVSKKCASPEDLAVMVREINDAVVSKEDLLSYKIHEYDPETRTIGVAGQEKDLSEKREEAILPSKQL